MRTVERLCLVSTAFWLCEGATEDTEDVRTCLADTHNVLQNISSRTNDLERCYRHAKAQFTIREELAFETECIRTHDVAVPCSELAKASLDMNFIDAAERLVIVSKQIREDLPGFVPTADSNTLIGLACIPILRGYYNAAARLFEQVLHDRERLLSPLDGKAPRLKDPSLCKSGTLANIYSTGHALYRLGMARQA
ncbi:MAG: hypothetical protein Q9159_005921 [Coniocarpon cinnabarinum]